MFSELIAEGTSSPLESPRSLPLGSSRLLTYKLVLLLTFLGLLHLHVIDRCMTACGVQVLLTNLKPGCAVDSGDSWTYPSLLSLLHPFRTLPQQHRSLSELANILCELPPQELLPLKYFLLVISLFTSTSTFLLSYTIIFFANLSLCLSESLSCACTHTYTFPLEMYKMAQFNQIYYPLAMEYSV